MSEIHDLGVRAREASRKLRTIGTRTKNQALESIAEALVQRRAYILDANAIDLAAGREAGLSDPLLERLTLTEARLEGIAADVMTVVGLPDPVGQTIDERLLPNGLRVSKRRVPLGVIGVIYESRPNVTVDIAALCLKSGNATIMRGGKEAANSNRALAEVVSEACNSAGVPADVVQLVQSADRSLVKEMLTANAYIDMIIPRGGAELHRFALENATIPVITGGIGICHVFVDESAEPAKAVPIIFNSKVQRPTVCNALDVILVHRAVAKHILPAIAADLERAEVRLRCAPSAYDILQQHPLACLAGPDDFDTEFLALIAAVKVVDGLDEAIEHIQQHGTHHSDAIVTENYTNAMRFVDEVDSAAVYVNASTRFTDGSQFGMGAEVAISTQRLHARGPMALEELTTYKWIVLGDGQIRP